MVAGVSVFVLVLGVNAAAAAAAADPGEKVAAVKGKVVD